LTKLVFLDTETTSLRYDRRAWEIGLIVREPGKADRSHQWFIHHDDLDLGNADPMSLRYGRFYDRHPQFNLNAIGDHTPESEVIRSVERLTRGAHIVGAVPNFDTETLAARMRDHGYCPSWQHHLIDVEPLMVGVLAARGEPVPMPWRSDDLSRRIGVEPPAEGERHAALADARWCAAIWDAVVKTDA
jgi:DNA polymerase III epsilon subunit-like protein